MVYHQKWTTPSAVTYTKIRVHQKRATPRLMGWTTPGGVAQFWLLMGWTTPGGIDHFWCAPSAVAYTKSRVHQKWTIPPGVVHPISYGVHPISIGTGHNLRDRPTSWRTDLRQRDRPQVVYSSLSLCVLKQFPDLLCLETLLVASEDQIYLRRVIPSSPVNGSY